MPQQELLIPQRQIQSIQERQSFVFVQILLQATVRSVPLSSKAGLPLTTSIPGCKYCLSSVRSLQNFLVLMQKFTLPSDLLPDECFETQDAAAICHGAECLYDRTTGVRGGRYAPDASFNRQACRESFKVLARSGLPGAGVNAILDWLVGTPDNSSIMRRLLIIIQGGYCHGFTKSYR